MKPWSVTSTATCPVVAMLFLGLTDLSTGAPVNSQGSGGSFRPTHQSFSGQLHLTVVIGLFPHTAKFVLDAPCF